MTLDELTPWLFSRTSGGIRWGLERTEELLAGVGDPHRRFRSILIAGTNGKGSVAALTESALRRVDRVRTGLYTSPHLVSFGERIRVDGRPLPGEVIAGAATRLKDAIERTGATFFEATTAIAFLLLAEAEVDVAVVEAGLGGRLDATNVVTPLATAITNIGLDHTEYLGGTLELIAAEKAGILKPSVPAVVGIPASETGPLRVVEARAREVGAPLVLLDEVATVADVRTSADGTAFTLSSRARGALELAIPLAGLHQVRNAALAAELVALLPADLRPSPEQVRSGFASVRWPGRMQIHRLRGTTWLLDVAHNPDGIDALGHALDNLDLPAPIVAVAGILGDKEWKRMLPPLLARVQGVILTSPAGAPESRRWDPEEAARWCADTAGITPRVIPDVAAALERAATLAPHGTVLVTGSVFTVGEALEHLELPVG